MPHGPRVGRILWDSIGWECAVSMHMQKRSDCRSGLHVALWKRKKKRGKFQVGSRDAICPECSISKRIKTSCMNREKVVHVIVGSSGVVLNP